MDRYIAGYERVRLLARSHTREEIPALANMSPSLVAEYLALLENFEGEAPVDTPPRAPPDTTSTPRRDEIGAKGGAQAPAEP